MSEMKLLSDDELLEIAGGRGNEGILTADQVKAYVLDLKSKGRLKELDDVKTVSDVEPAIQKVMGGNKFMTITDDEAAILLAFLNEQREMA